MNNMLGMLVSCAIMTNLIKYWCYKFLFSYKGFESLLFFSACMELVYNYLNYFISLMIDTAPEFYLLQHHLPF